MADLIRTGLLPKGDFREEVLRIAREELYKPGITYDHLVLISEYFRKQQEEENKRIQQQMDPLATVPCSE